jgi:hypothetical protein
MLEVAEKWIIFLLPLNHQLRHFRFNPLSISDANVAASSRNASISHSSLTSLYQTNSPFFYQLSKLFLLTFVVSSIRHFRLKTRYWNEFPQIENIFRKWAFASKFLISRINVKSSFPLRDYLLRTATLRGFLSKAIALTALSWYGRQNHVMNPRSLIPGFKGSNELTKNLEI